MKTIKIELTEKEAQHTKDSLNWNFMVSGQNADTYKKDSTPIRTHDALKEACIDQMRTCEDVIKKIEKALKS